MLKTVSSITNAIGALNFKGTWNASTNTPTLASGVGTKGDYYVVGIAGSTTLDGISTWGVGDWATYNGSVWQRVEGGADLDGVNLNVSGTTNLAALTDSTALALDASKNVVSVTNTGTGNNVLQTAPTLVGDVILSTGNLVIGTSVKGIDFSANTPAAGMTSELLNWYEEGTFTPTIVGTTTAGTGTYSVQIGTYTRMGRVVRFNVAITWSAHTGTGNMNIAGLPFTASATANSQPVSVASSNLTVPVTSTPVAMVSANTATIRMYATPTAGTDASISFLALDTAATLWVAGTYIV